MRVIVFVLFISIFPIKFCFSQEWLVSNYIEGDIVMPYSSTIDPNDNVIILSRIRGNVEIGVDNINSYSGSFDYLLTKFDNNGDLVWYKQIGTDNNELIGGGVVSDDLGNIYIVISGKGTMYYESTSIELSTTDFDIIAFKYSADGVFNENYLVASGPNNQRPSAIEIMGQDSLVISGYYATSADLGGTSINTDTLSNGLFLSTFINGSLEWHKNFISNSQCVVEDIAIDENDDQFYLGLKLQGKLYLDIQNSLVDFISENSNNDALLYKYDKQQSKGLWVRKVSGGGRDNFISLKIDDYKNIYSLFNSNSSNVTINSTDLDNIVINKSSDYDAIFLKYNRGGDLLNYNINGDFSSDAYKDFVLSDNILYTTGIFENQIIFNEDTLNSNYGYSGFLSAFNMEEDPLSGKGIYGSDADVSVSNINIDSRGRPVIIGYYLSSELQIGENLFPNTLNERNLFFAVYSHPFNATFTEKFPPTCHGDADGSLIVTPYFGVGPYTYNWSHNGVSDSTATGLTAGTYSVTVTDSRDSVAVATAILNDPDPMSASYALTDVSCPGSLDGSIVTTPSGGNGGYTYQWAGSTGIIPTSKDQSDLAAGDYDLTITDSKGCVYTDMVTISEPLPVTFNADTTNVSTIGGSDGSITLSPAGGTPAYSYSWEGPDGFVSANKDITGLSEGSYNVTITDANLCAADTSIQIKEPGILVYTSDLQAVTCKGNQDGLAALEIVNVSPAAASTFWVNESLDTIAQNVFQIDTLAGGRYYVTAYETVAPDNNDSLSFVIPTSSSALVVSSFFNNPKCYNETNGLINVVVDGGKTPYTYSWDDGPTTEDRVGLAAGTYTLTVTDAYGCQKTTSEELVNPSEIQVSLISSAPDCPEELSGTMEADVTGGTAPYSYMWDDPGNQTEAVATELAAGSYTVTVTDLLGCERTAAQTISDPALLTIDEVRAYDVSCFGATDGAVKVDVSGGTEPYTYTWDPAQIDADTLDALAAGTYNFTVTGTYNCNPQTGQVIINEPAEWTVDIDTTDVTCAGGSDGAISVTSQGGDGTFDYNWSSTADNVSVLSDISAGTYSLTISEGNCPDREFLDIPVTEPQPIVINNIDKTDVTSVGGNDGSLTINASGGTAPLRYSLDNLNYQADIVFSNLSADTYTVYVTDGNDCGPEISDPIIITEPVSNKVVIFGTEFSIYPNPADERLILEFEKPEKLKNRFEVELYSANGKLIFNKEFMNKPVLSVDVSNVPQGTYYLFIEGKKAGNAIIIK